MIMDLHWLFFKKINYPCLIWEGRGRGRMGGRKVQDEIKERGEWDQTRRSRGRAQLGDNDGTKKSKNQHVIQNNNESS